MAGAVKATCDSLERTQSARRKRMARNIAMYEGRPLRGLDPAAYFSTDELTHEDYDVMRVNLARSLVNTAVAKFAGKQKPKTQFVVNDGDWSTKRKAKKLERFVEAHMLQRQGTNSDGWEQFQRAALHCCVADIGVVKTMPNMAEKKVDIRCVVPWRILVDPLDAQEGQPLNLFDVYPVDRFKLAEDFPKFRRQILSAPDVTSEGGTSALFGVSYADVSRFTFVREAFRLKVGQKDGRHAIIVGGVDITGGEEWTRDTFPYEFLVWEAWVQGFYGTSIVDNVYHLTNELNASIQRMADAERVGSNQMVFVEEGTVKVEQLESNIQKTIVQVRPGTGFAPVFNTPNAISQSTVNWTQLMRAMGHDMAGVSEMAATGEKQQGVDSGAAMRTLSQIGTERFSVQWQMYERRVAVGQARQILACARDIASDEPDYAVKWPGGQFLQEFKLADVDLDEDMYVIQPYPVPGVINTPADRQSLGDELFAQQIIGPQARARIHLSKDVEGEIAGTGSWSRLIERYVESWLDATKESEAAGLNGDPKAFRYRPPVPFMPLADAIVQVGRAYADAELEGCPDYNLGFFVRFMGDCDRKIQEIEAKKAPPPEVPPPPPPAGNIGAPVPVMPPVPGGMLQ